jgi:hypothetical protein
VSQKIRHSSKEAKMASGGAATHRERTFIMAKVRDEPGCDGAWWARRGELGIL